MPLGGRQGRRGGRSGWIDNVVGGTPSGPSIGAPWDSSMQSPLTPGNIETRMLGEAGRIEDTEVARYQSGLGTLTDAYASAQSILGQGVDANALFSRAADEIGSRSRSQMEMLRSSLGARGLNPNSGAAQGLLSRMAFQTQGALTGATRDIAIENQRQRAINAAQSFANALNLANYTNAPVGGARLETMQNIFEGQIAREGLRAQARSNQQANQTGLLGSLIGGGASILGSLLGAI